MIRLVSLSFAALILFSFSASAVDIVNEGVNTSYIYGYDSSSVDVYEGGPNTSAATLPVTFTAFGEVFRLNGGCAYVEKSINYNFNAANSEHDYLFNLYYCLNYNNFSTGTFFHMSVDSETFQISTDDDISVKLSLSTLALSGTGGLDIGEYYSSPTIHLYNSDVLVATLNSTIINKRLLGSVDDLDMYDYDIEYVADITRSITFDRIVVEGFSIPMPFNNLVNSGSNYNRFRFSMSDVTVTVLASQTAQEYYQAIQAGNRDMQNYYNTINTVDSNKIDSINDDYNKLNNVNQQVSQMTSFETELRNDFDVSYKPDVLTDSVVLDTVDTFWNILPLDNEFFTSVFGMVGSIALLSLILHAGGRGVFTHGGGSHSSSNSYRQKNNKNKDGD